MMRIIYFNQLIYDIKRLRFACEEYRQNKDYDIAKIYFFFTSTLFFKVPFLMNPKKYQIINQARVEIEK